MFFFLDKLENVFEKDLNNSREEKIKKEEELKREEVKEYQNELKKTRGK